MNKAITASIIVPLLFMAGCGNGSNEPVMKSNGYEMVLSGHSSLTHQPGGFALWYTQSGGARSIVWSYIVGHPELFDSTALFNSGLTDADDWKNYPAVMAATAGSLPSNLTEYVTRKTCAAQGVEYMEALNRYRYRIESRSGESVVLVGLKLPSVPGSLKEPVQVTITLAEIRAWIEESTRTGTIKSYGSLTYYTP